MQHANLALTGTLCDLNTHICTINGFCCRGIIPPKLVAGHYAAVYNDELWVFPGPKNQAMRSVYCCELQRYRWQEREVRGDPPALPEARRNLDCFLDGNKLIVFGEIP